MKYFTFDWWTRSQSRYDLTPILKYRKHQTAIRDSLTPNLRRLEEEGENLLHDAILTRFSCRMMRNGARVVVGLRDHGGRAFQLAYDCVRKVEFVTGGATPLPGPGGIGSLGYWETDCVVGGFEHQFLFSSGTEIHIVFGRIRIQDRGRKEAR